MGANIRTLRARGVGLSTSDEAQEMYTPREGAEYFDALLKTMWEPEEPKDRIVVRDPFPGNGTLLNHMKDLGYLCTEKLTENIIYGDEVIPHFTVNITNPPFRTKDRYTCLNQLFSEYEEYGVPFITILRLEHLGGVGAYKMFQPIQDEMIIGIPEKRINFITPKNRSGEKNTSSASFHTILLGYNFNQAVMSDDSAKGIQYLVLQ